jgi:AraC-like DNA-binding protein
MKKRQHTQLLDEAPSPVADGPADILLITEDYKVLGGWLGEELRGEANIVRGGTSVAAMKDELMLSSDIVVCDLTFAEKDVVNLAGILRKGGGTRYVPVLLFVADTNTGKRKKRASAASKFEPSDCMAYVDLVITLKSLLASRKQISGTNTAQQTMNGELADRQLAWDAKNPFLQALSGIIVKHMDNPSLSVQHICAEMSVSQSVLYRRLTTYTGHSLVPFIRNIRLMKAKELLAETEMTLSEIAFAVGFSDAKFFSKVFLQAFGMRAIDFRKNRSRQ